MIRKTGPILLLALLLRGAYGVSLPNSLLIPDAGSFDQIAWTLSSTGRYADPDGPTAVRPPSYVVFLAMVYRLFGHSYRAARLVQIVLGTGFVWLMMRWAANLLELPRAATLTGWLCAVYPFFIYYDNQLIADAFVTFWLGASLYLFLRWTERPESWGRAAAGGAALAVLSLSKTVFLPLGTLLPLIEGCGVSSPASLRRWGRVAVFAVFLWLPCLLWGLRNQHYFGRFMLDSHGGYTTLITIAYYAQTKQGIGGEYLKQQPFWPEAQRMNEARRDAFFMEKTKAFIREHPYRVFRQSLGNLKNIWRLYPRQDLQFREGKRFLTFVSLITEPVLVILGLLGAWRTREQWRRIYPLYMAIFFLTAVHTLTTGQMRYRLPLMPLFILFSAAEASTWYEN